MGNILIVEDEIDIAELYHIILSERGHLVFGPYPDPEESLEKSRGAAIDLIILDERLGGHSGTSFIDPFRHAFPAAKILLVTADPEAASDGLGRGADSVLKKPVPLGQLLEQVQTLLGGKIALG